MMKKHRKINKLKVGISIFLIVLILTITVFGRYIYNNAREAYLTSKRFFFSSNLLEFNGTTYECENWSGIGIYTIDVDLFSQNNELSRMDYDLNYTITCESLSEKILCSINTEDGLTSVDGTIIATVNGNPNNVSRVTIIVKPNPSSQEQLKTDDVVKLKVRAWTEEPYEKELSCEFKIKIGTEITNKYSIEDVKYRDYALLKLANASESSTQVTLEFDPKILRLDLNNDIYLNNVSMETKPINGNDYVYKIVFNMREESSKNIKFYKVDRTQNYSNSGDNKTSIINVTI